MPPRRRAGGEWRVRVRRKRTVSRGEQGCDGRELLSAAGGERRAGVTQPSLAPALLTFAIAGGSVLGGRFIAAGEQSPSRGTAAMAGPSSLAAAACSGSPEMSS